MSGTKSDRISFVLYKEYTPILKTIAKKNNTTVSQIINNICLNVLMDNIDILDDPEQIKVVQNLIRSKRRGF